MSPLYAYGVLPADNTRSTGQPPLPPGVAGSEVHLVAAGELAMAVSAVSSEDFAQDRLASRLEDAEWTAALAQAHFDVVEALFAQGPLLPLRMCIVFESADRVRAALADRAPVLASTLDRLAGSAEWSVKVVRRPARSGGQPVPAEPAATSGADYLKRAAARRDERQDAGLARARFVERLRGQLAPVVTANRDAPAASGHLLRASYLVRTDAAPAFLRVIEDADAAAERLGLTVEIAGPWAPYSFVPRLQEAS